MKHIKSYKLFESKEVVMACVWNAINNINGELFKDLVEQHGELVDFKSIVDKTLDKNPNRPNSYEIRSRNILPFLKYIPPQYLNHVTNLRCNTEGITILEGIQYLHNLEFLYCGQNNIIELNLQGLINLKELYCDNCFITNLDISGLINLKKLDCHGNRHLKKLDISKLTELTHLWCYNTELTELDISNNPKLDHLDCRYTKLTELDISNNLDITLNYDIHKMELNK